MTYNGTWPSRSRCTTRPWRAISRHGLSPLWERNDPYWHTATRLASTSLNLSTLASATSSQISFPWVPYSTALWFTWSKESRVCTSLPTPSARLTRSLSRRYRRMPTSFRNSASILNSRWRQCTASSWDTPSTIGWKQLESTGWPSKKLLIDWAKQSQEI